MSLVLTLGKTLSRLQADCPDIVGALLAMPEGLVLGGIGTLHGEKAAALASHLADQMDHHLALMEATACTEAVFWTPTALWGLGRSSSRHVMLVQALPQCRAGTVRLALVRMRVDLAPVLPSLTANMSLSAPATM